jgi:hypothetical protein
MLEEEAAVLRKMKVKTEAVPQPEDEGMQAEEQRDHDSAHDDTSDPEPKEKGSEAVERRTEKVMADLRDQGVVDINDERAYEAKKVWFILHQSIKRLYWISDYDFSGSVHCLPSGCVPRMLLLLYCNRSS